MHRHGYKGRKFGRENDQRRALIKSLASELIDHEAITTTLPKAKELVPYVEKLITKAKKGGLHNRRQIISKLADVDSAHKLVDEIAPKLTNRVSGHLSVKRSGLRRGDNTQMARVKFVDELSAKAVPAATKPADSKKPIKEVKADESKEKEHAKVAAKKAPVIKAAKVVAKRTGVRGNR